MSENEKKNYFAFYETFEEQLSGLPEETQARFYLAIVKYGLHGKDTEFDNPLEAALFKQFKFAIDNQRAKSRKNSDNRKNKTEGNETKKKETEGNETKKKETEGNETKKKETEGNETKKKETEGNETKKKETEGNADEEEIEIEVEDEEELEREREMENPAPESADKRANAPPSIPESAKPPENHEAPKKFKPPSVEEVRDYCRERGNGISAETFCSFYESKGWLIGKDKMRNWKQAVITWEQREREKRGAGTVWQKEHDAAAEYMDLF